MNLILASTSPRRSELLRTAGLAFQIIAPDADETPRKGESPQGLVRRLSREKALSVAARLEKDFLVLAADTIVVSPNGKKILGKPRDREDAKKMLLSLQGRTHLVHTGYCLLDSKLKPLCRVITSRVTLRKLSAASIEKYVATGEPMDKAGSYAAQGIGSTFIEQIRGSYTNVVGLPISQVLVDLEKEFGLSGSWQKS